MSDRRRLALVLAGGRSRRMGEDKAAIAVGGETLLDRTVALAKEFADDVWVSVSADQTVDSVRARHPQLVDSRPGKGPLGGILTALDHDPEAEWLVLACDMPGLTRDGLGVLVSAASEDATSIALASAAAGSDLPEPLYAIWRPEMRDRVADALDAGRRCARKCLLQAGATLVEVSSDREITNINTPEERDQWMEAQR
ncbi:MAG: molybdenum cofactor guanylyltransferase [Pseudomonadota bacterium]